MTDSRNKLAGMAASLREAAARLWERRSLGVAGGGSLPDSLDGLLTLARNRARQIAMVVCVALVALMGLSIANTTLFVLDAVNVPEFDSPVARSKPQTGSPFAGLRASSMELFGKVTETATAPEVVDAPETRLNLELQGVFIAEDERFSTAIIAEGKERGELYHIGDRLPGKATLAAVHPDHILIRRGSRLEKLAFTDAAYRTTAPPSRNSGGSGRANDTSLLLGNDFAQGGQASVTTVQMRGGNPGITRGNAGNRSGGPGSRPIVSSTPPNNFRDAVTHYQQRALNDPQGTLRELGVSPVSSTDAQGYRLGSRANHPALRQAGFQSGDVILSVNGQRVGNATSDAALASQVLNSSSVRVEVQRGQRRFYLTVPVPQQ